MAGRGGCAVRAARGVSIRVIVCGGRAYADYARVFAVLDALHAERTITALATGRAAGADHYAAHWAITRVRELVQFNADWRQYGRAAGPIRNARMLAEFAPDVVVAFPGGAGTADMVAKARAAGVEVVEA